MTKDGLRNLENTEIDNMFLRLDKAAKRGR
jgi:hypothetical protein